MERPALPQYVVPPGEVLAEWLEENVMTQAELARRMSVSGKHVSKLVNGLVSLTPEIAHRLELVTGMPAQTWLRFEAQYRADQARLAAEAQAAEARELVEAFPLAQLRKLRLVTKTLREPGAVAVELMAFFRVATLEQLRDMAQPASGYAYASGSVNWAARQSWLRLGELAADQMDVTAQYTREGLASALNDLRELVPTPPEHFGRELAERLGDLGVYLVYVKEVPGTCAYGATRWYKGRPLIQLSLRRKDDGQFWFTLFHELAHLLYHAARDSVFIHDVDTERLDDAEKEADAFSRDLLIPPDAWARISRPKSTSEIRTLAEAWGISPGVVLGRLHRERLWPHDHGQGLFRRLDITENVEV